MPPIDAPPVEVIQGHSANLEPLVQLAAKWTPSDLSWSQAELLKTASSPNCLVLVSRAVRTRGHWMGVLLVEMRPFSAELLFVFTDPNFRRCGLARALLRTAIQMVGTDRQREIFSLEVRASNLKAIKLYESSGFEKIRIRKRYYADGEDALVYQLALRDE